jgi:hypothetical protein
MRPAAEIVLFGLALCFAHRACARLILLRPAADIVRDAPLAEKATTIAEKHYGSHQASVDAAKKRADFSTTIRSSLARE